MTTRTTRDLKQHPCFNADAKGKFGRVHLPVAPKCNIKCNFCDRKYDCVNESRPGVTSTLLSPEQAGIYMDKVLEKEPRITVAGIAGPGDPFANGPETIATMRNIRKNHPETILCLSSNGMGIAPYIDAIAEIEVSHVTITVCAVDPEIGQKIYAWVQDGKVIYKGLQGAKLLLSRQVEAIKKLKEHGITVKINCIVIPGINDHHIEDIAIKMKELGADLFNAMALFPNVNTPFGSIEQPTKEKMEELRATAEKYLPQMRHCTRCRADAVGLLGDDRTEEFRSCLSSCSTIKPMAPEKRAYVAVASEEGVLINQHLGECRSFEIWEQKADGYQKVEERRAPDTGGGIKRWHKLAKILGDCRAVLISGIGETPYDILLKAGIQPVEAAGFIEEGLETVYENKKTTILKGRRVPCSEGKCSGSGGGCG
ncbi:nitrogenase cofactor biosynthesis protein NifB [Desulforhopalus sp. IMCC35007]|uniref:nitrogenase cofactor biosynthesis protein NifB n=1 Tax=Desulforhopalus sp. IMCC35007 TaxID=2569543 RepID=UPI0010AECEF9|nr:nitrogenase cofactor biosynthesis protein NifB [Desulforhopalus sp. IMCC35007]TKB08429.1 nitrogenase cofactor biosynthesis protein NifB [Desulforhopalus sp. IMCC35007]